MDELREPVAALEKLGELNFLMSDGACLVAFANTKLQYVERVCIERECQKRVVMLATSPLTDEAWRPLEMDRVHVFVGRSVFAANGADAGSAPG
ncbi:MAG: class II glutamine amidotransferase [Coriobacteriia bacterium]